MSSSIPSAGSVRCLYKVLNIYTVPSDFFVEAARKLNVTVHVTKNDKKRRSNLDRRTTRHTGYAISLSRRWPVEKGFGWLKQTGPIRQVKLRGLHKVDWLFVFSCAAHNLCRLPRLIVQRQVA